MDCEGPMYHVPSEENLDVDALVQRAKENLRGHTTTSMIRNVEVSASPDLFDLPRFAHVLVPT